MGQRDRYAAGQRDRYAAGQRDRYAAGRRNRYAAVASQLSRYAASDNVSGTHIRGKFCRSEVRVRLSVLQAQIINTYFVYFISTPEFCVLQ